MRIETQSGTEMGARRKVGTGAGTEAEKNGGTEVEIEVEIGIEDEVEVGTKIVGWIVEVGPETDRVRGTDLEIGTDGTGLIEVEEMIGEVEIDLVGSGSRVVEVMIRKREVKMWIRRRRETRRKRRRCSQENPSQVWFMKLISQLFNALFIYFSCSSSTSDSISCNDIINKIPI